MTESETQQKVVKSRGRKKKEQVVSKQEPKTIQKKVINKKSEARSHPKFIDMVTECLEKLDEKSGLSRQAILKYIVLNFSVDEKNSNQYLKVALKNGVKSGQLKQLKGIGASGSFKLAEKATKTTKTQKAIKVAVSKPKSRQVVTKSEEKTSAKKESVGKKNATPVKRGRKPRTVTKEAAQTQTPTSAPRGRKPPAVREQVNIKKARGSKKTITETVNPVTSSVEKASNENVIVEQPVEKKNEENLTGAPQA